jgi:hypothetical protein
VARSRRRRHTREQVEGICDGPGLGIIARKELAESARRDQRESRVLHLEPDLGHAASASCRKGRERWERGSGEKGRRGEGGRGGGEEGKRGRREEARGRRHRRCLLTTPEITGFSRSRVLKLQGLGFRVWWFGVRESGLGPGCSVEGVGSRVRGLGLRV